MNRWTRLGIDAFQAGNRPQARRFFRYALMENPVDVRSWLWLVEVSDTNLERKRCLDEVLRIEPEHPQATRALRELNERMAVEALPHVDPFYESAEPEDDQPALLPASTPLSSQPPFVMAISQQLTTESPPFRPASSRWNLRKIAPRLGLALAGTGLVVLIGVLIAQRILGG